MAHLPCKSNLWNLFVIVAPCFLTRTFARAGRSRDQIWGFLDASSTNNLLLLGTKRGWTRREESPQQDQVYPNTAISSLDLSIIGGSLFYHTKYLETTAVVIWCYIDKTENLFYSRLALLVSYCKMAPMLVKCCFEWNK